LDKQLETVERLDFILETCNRTSRNKIKELRQLNELRFQTPVVFRAPLQTLGEVCKVNQGTYIKPDMKINGEYPVYGGGNISFFINSFNRENEIVVAKDGVSADCVRYVSGKFFLNHHGWTIACKEMVNKKYMFYVLYSVKSQLLNIAKGTAQLGINQENFYKLTIPVPSLEQQREIVEFCEANDGLIRQLEQEIDKNETFAHTFVQSACKKRKRDTV
jgi:restriction endonuclease S subunit